jgi:hypothetical protein
VLADAARPTPVEAGLVEVVRMPRVIKSGVGKARG